MYIYIYIIYTTDLGGKTGKTISMFIKETKQPDISFHMFPARFGARISSIQREQKCIYIMYLYIFYAYVYIYLHLCIYLFILFIYLII